MPAALTEILHRRDIWRGNRRALGGPAAVASGWAGLDAELPGGGWERGAVSELVLEAPGSGELRLLLPALARLTREGKSVALVAPPFLPYAPAWQGAGVELSRLVWIQPATARERLWAFEQSLREPACGAVLAWFDGALADAACRRLQLAAAAGGGLGFLLRQGAAPGLATPFHLRLGVAAAPEGTLLRILKRQGYPLASTILLANPEANRVVVGATPARAVPGRVPARPRSVGA